MITGSQICTHFLSLSFAVNEASHSKAVVPEGAAGLSTGLLEMIVGVLTTCHTQYTWDSGICFLFTRTTLQVFVTYLTGALYVHPLWYYKHQHDNRVRSKLSVACLRWWFQWRFWLIPSVPGYTRTLSLETVHTAFDFEWNCQMVVIIIIIIIIIKSYSKWLSGF